MKMMFIESQNVSLIERVFHTIKNEYKKVLQARNRKHLHSILDRVIEAYMDRPHSAHGIYTPREVITRKTGWFDLRMALKLSAAIRLESNRNTKCKNCKCDDNGSGCKNRK